PLASSALNSSSDTALAPEANRHCSSPSSAVIEAMNDDLPAPLESFGPAPATTISVPGTTGTAWVDRREMLTACTAISTRSPTAFSTCATTNPPLPSSGPAVPDHRRSSRRPARPHRGRQRRVGPRRQDQLLLQPPARRRCQAVELRAGHVAARLLARLHLRQQPGM